jgi:hypothetical protein
MTREFQAKLKSGEVMHDWNGFSPHYAGCFYGDKVCLGGEEKFSHCYDFSAGIADVEWWIVDELEKLTQEEKDELLHILKRNKNFDEYKSSIVPELAKLLGVEKYQIHRIFNKTLYEFIKLIHSKSNDATKREWEPPAA